jgi:hypothetical protein
VAAADGVRRAARAAEAIVRVVASAGNVAGIVANGVVAVAIAAASSKARPKSSWRS